MLNDAILAEQILLEVGMVQSGRDRFEANDQRMISSGENSATSYNRRLIKQFVEPLSECIRSQSEYYSKRRGKTSKVWYYLSLLPTIESAYIIIKMVFDAMGSDDIGILMLAERIGGRIEDQVRFNKLEGSYGASVKNYIQKVKKNLAKSKSRNYDFQKNVLVHSESKLSDSSDRSGVTRWSSWPKNDKIHLGSKSIEMFITSVRYKGKPILKRADPKRDYSVKGKYRMLPSTLEPTEDIVKWIRDFRSIIGEMNPLFSPCVIPPQDWVNPFSGGYHTKSLQSKTTLVKTPNKKLLEKMTYEKMPTVYESLNFLQSVPYVVSRKTLGVAEEVLRMDLGYAMPDINPYRPPPPPVRDEITHLRGAELREEMSNQEWEEFISWKKDAYRTYDKEISRRSKYLEASRTVAQASKYSMYDYVYFVMTMDFRSRVYSNSSLISPQGNDLQKALLEFHEKVPLGKDGYYWLAVEGARLYGYKKNELGRTNFDEKFQFISTIEPEVLDIAIDPIRNKSWVGTSKPWQFLRWCFEWSSLKKHIDSGKTKESFLSGIPCYHDGSCSGIQHYSAILRDPVSGSAVNLLNNDRPESIYDKVADVVRAKFEKLKEGYIPRKPNGDRLINLSELDLMILSDAWLQVGINGELTKTAVMTLPYGSTQITCRDSVEDYLDEVQEKEDNLAKSESRKPDLAHPFSKEGGLDRVKAVSLCSKLIWDSISSQVRSARKAMSFIRSVAKMTAIAGKPLSWETPTGFIVEQSVFETKSTKIKTHLLGRIDFIVKSNKKTLDLQSMQSSAAPNFIHSMDASHLMLSSLAAKREGISSISCNHDAFATQAGNVTVMRKVLVEEFVKMYSDNDVLSDFKEYNEDNLHITVNVDVPEPMGLDLRDVLKSTYMFS